MNLDETCLLFNDGELKVLESKDKPRHDRNFSNSIFSVTVLRVGSAAGVNGPVTFMEKGTKVQPKFRGNNLMTRYIFP